MPPAGRILVVADDDMTELLVRLLEREGHRTARAAADPSALRRVAKGGIDCVVLDRGSAPPTRSMAVLDALRSHTDPAVASVPVVLLGASGETQVPSSHAEVGAFLVRPFHADDFLRTVAEVI